MILPIQTGKNNPVLRKKAVEVKQITPQIKQLILDMIDTLEASQNNVGLAAPQVNKSLRIIAFQPDPSKPAQVLINPLITKTSRKTEIIEEGCLSLPNYTAKIKRPVKAIVKTLNQEGKEVKIKAKGLTARILQHEIDHLNGILICDTLIKDTP